MTAQDTRRLERAVVDRVLQPFDDAADFAACVIGRALQSREEAA